MRWLLLLASWYDNGSICEDIEGSVGMGTFGA